MKAYNETGLIYDSSVATYDGISVALNTGNGRPPQTVAKVRRPKAEAPSPR